MGIVTQLAVLMVTISGSFLWSRPGAAAAAVTGVLRNEALFLTCPIAQQDVQAVLSADVLADSSRVLSARSALDCASLCGADAGCGGVAACPARDWAGRPQGVLCWGVGADVAQRQQCPPQGPGVAGGDQCTFMQKTTAEVTATAAPPQVTIQLQLTTTPEATTTAVDAETSSAPEATTTAVDAETSSAPEATTQLVCANGGTSDGTRCWCPLPYAGRNCSRYMRDCAEGAREQNHTGSPQGNYNIQPVGSSSEFQVRCAFYGSTGQTYALHRKEGESGNWTARNVWDTVKHEFRFGVDSEDFFLGLEKMHQIVSQGPNQLHILLFYSNSSSSPWIKEDAYYTGISIGPESSSYELDYGAFWNTAAQNQLGLHASRPIKFSTGDNPYPSAASTGGWMGTDGLGFKFLDDPPIWKMDLGGAVGIVDQEIALVEFGLSRDSDLYQPD